MNPTIFFSVCSLFYCLFLMFTVFSKTEKNNAENKIFKILLLINLGSLICESAGIFLGSNYKKFELLNDIALRLMLVLYVSWFSMFIVFILNISKRRNKLNIRDNKIIFVVMLLAQLAVVFLPIIYNTNKDGVIIYSSGLAVQTVYYYVMACEISCLFIMFTHAKKVKIANYASLFALVVLSTLSAAIQSYYPSLLLSASTETFVLYIAYINTKKMETMRKIEICTISSI